MGRGGAGLAAGDAEGALEFSGELDEAVGDSGRLLDEGGHHALGHLRLVADQFDGSDNQGKLVVNIVAHGGELAVQLGELFDGQSDWLTGQRHP